MKLVGYDYASQAPFVAWPTGIVYRSPAAADRLQIICVREYIFDWNYTTGSWYIWDSWPEGRQNCFTANRGQHVNMGPISRSNGTTWGRYRGVWTINWYANVPTYRRIGSVVLDFKDEGDYRCATTGCRILYNVSQDRYFLFFPG